ncbi:unnamed protein product, partial [Cladocopium goreaui]
DWSSFSTEKAAVLKAFVDFVLGSEGQGMLSDFSFVVVPAAMNTWQSVWDNTITKPTGFVPLTFESNTEKWVGQGANVVSSKRNSYSLWKLGELESAAAAMKARLDDMETHLNEYGIVPLHGSGTTNTKNWFAKAMKLMEERARVPLFLTYRAVGSGTGQKEFVGNAASSYKSYSNFGAGDIPMSSTHFQTMTSQTPPESMVHIPLALGAIAVFHSVPTGEIGGSLKLDACLLAKIFSGQVETWDHADIKAQNPGINVPAGSKIKVFHRRLGSSSTGGITGYLNKKCPEHWSLGAGSSISWPAKSSFQPVEGSPGMQSALKDNQYGIGYLDAGHGHDFGLSEVALTNLAGQTRTSKESIALGGVAEAGTAAANGNVFPTDVSADWSSVNLYDMAGDSTWPIVLVSYLYVKKDQSATNPKTAAALKAFIKMVVDDTDGMAQQFGFTPPSADLKRLSNSAADAIAYPSTMQAFDVESSTNAYGGMATNVISMKRHSYDIYDSNVMRDALSKLETDYRTVKQEEPMKKYDNTLPVLCSVVALVISLLTSCMACFAFKAAKSAGAAPPALPQAESGTIIGLAAPMPKEEKKAVDLKDEEKGKAAIWKTFHLEVHISPAKPRESVSLWYLESWRVRLCGTLIVLSMGSPGTEGWLQSSDNRLWSVVLSKLSAAVLPVFDSKTSEAVLSSRCCDFWNWASAIAFQRNARLLKDVRLTYRAVGSSTGQREFTQQTSGDFTAGLTDFAAGDIPMDPSRYSSLTTAGRSMVHVPFCLGAIGVFHSVPAGEVGDAKGLKLSPCVLAKIMKGEITTWDHQDIKAENPNLNVPAGTTIKVGHRTEGSSSTTGFTGYLNSKCPADWSLGSGSIVSWPTSSGFTPVPGLSSAKHCMSPCQTREVQGSGGMASFIAGTPYAIGYLDAGHGHQQDFQEVNLKNEADTWLNSKDALMATDANGNNGVAAAGKAAAEAAPFPAATDDWSSVNLYGKAGTNTWPI